MNIYINISEKYGEQEFTTVNDYKELNPNGVFIEKDDSIYEWEFLGMPH